MQYRAFLTLSRGFIDVCTGDKFTDGRKSAKKGGGITRRRYLVRYNRRCAFFRFVYRYDRNGSALDLFKKSLKVV
jgi:hypothetical protein